MSYAVGFTSLADEVVDAALQVRGTLPDWLRGTLVRTGPALFEIEGLRVRHWFDGLGMLHRLSFSGDGIRYSNRFLESKAYTNAQERGRITHRDFGTDPPRSYLRRIISPPTDNANVNVLKFDDTYVATTETVKMYEFRPRDLTTVGRFRYERGPFGVTQPAHPHLDPANGEWVSYVTSPVRSSYKIFRVPRGTTRGQSIASIPAKEPAYIHSFALTPSYVVLVEYPFVFRPLDLGLSGKPFSENFKWKPDRPTRFMVVDRRDGKLTRVYETDPFFCFHHVNAFETADELIIDLTYYPDAGIVRDLALEHLLDESASLSLGEVRRYHLARDGNDLTHETLCSERADFPRIDLWRNTRRYRYLYAAGTVQDPSRNFIDQLFKLDVESRAVTSWRERDCYPGEPVFVGANRAGEEDEGVVLSLVLDASRDTSFLLVLDAGSFTERVRADLPHRVPFGLHGQFFDAPGSRLTPFGEAS